MRTRHPTAAVHAFLTRAKDSILHATLKYMGKTFVRELSIVLEIASTHTQRPTSP